MGLTILMAHKWEVAAFQQRQSIRQAKSNQIIERGDAVLQVIFFPSA